MLYVSYLFMAFAYSINNVKIGLTLTPRIYNPAANTNGCQTQIDAV